MKTKIKSPKFIIVAIVAFLSLIGLTSFRPASVHAATAYNICGQNNVSAEVKQANGCNGDATNDLSNAIVSIINAVIYVLGIVAAIFIIVGGVNYMTSAGDAAKIEKAKKTILYAVIGLVIAALTFAIVNFVIAGLLKQ
ncbi:hypothetical protein IJG27_01310 [Candidatus Saccharibacteria bacterium]|nr:hypothetical protein [Candidatus Saccharibacteria bacterium]